MKRYRLLAAAVLAVFLLTGAVFTGTAAAEEGGNPLIITEFPVTFTSESETIAPAFETTGGTKVSCTSYTATGEFTSGRLGTSSVHFKGCTSSGVKCKSSGAAEGEISTTGDVHLVARRDANNILRLYLHILPLTGKVNVLTFACGVLTVEIKGGFLGELEPEGKIEEKAEGTLLVLTKHVFSLWKGEKGKQNILECEVDKEFCFEGEKHKVFSLEANFGKGAEKADFTGHAYILFSRVVHIIF
ncbi:MAG TPA: hypothetical protein VL988_05070 [Solirubrobacteraceae bacterium]|nr:hypothetical protein [Solirubrobacteraceae bacterium]